MRGSLERLPVLSLLQLAVARHDDHDSAASRAALRPCDSSPFGDAHAERARVRLYTRHADVGMSVETAEPTKPREPVGGEHAEAVERRVQAGYVVALGREEHVPVGVLEAALCDVELVVEEVDDDIKCAEARAEMPRPGALDGNESIKPADVGQKPHAHTEIAVRRANTVDVVPSDERELGHAERR